ncbi:MAG: HU family DNA-binding protein [Pseudomonadota bacterium]
MIRSELIARIAAQNPHLYAKDVEAVVATILDTMGDALIRGDRVELRGFGMFEARQRPARVRRNPRSQARVEKAPGAAVRFKPAKAMKDRLNRELQDPMHVAERLSRAS